MEINIKDLNFKIMAIINNSSNKRNINISKQESSNNNSCKLKLIYIILINLKAHPTQLLITILHFSNNKTLAHFYSLRILNYSYIPNNSLTEILVWTFQLCKQLKVLIFLNSIRYLLIITTFLPYLKAQILEDHSILICHLGMLFILNYIILVDKNKIIWIRVKTTLVLLIHLQIRCNRFQKV